MSNRSLMRAAEPRGIIGTQLKVWTAGFSSETVAPSLSIHTQSYNCLKSRQQCLKHPSSNRSCGCIPSSPDVGCGTDVLSCVFARRNLLFRLLKLCLSADCQAKSSEHTKCTVSQPCVFREGVQIWHFISFWSSSTWQSLSSASIGHRCPLKSYCASQLQRFFQL